MKRFWILLLLTAVASCGNDEVELSVNLLTDIVPGVEFTSVEVFTDDTSVGMHSVEEVDTFVPTERVADLRLSPKADRIVTIELSDVNGVVASSSLLVDNAKNNSATVLLKRVCKNVLCDVGFSCLDGVCIAADCINGEEMSCPRNECTLASDCPTKNACATPTCEESSCLYVDSGACANDMYCSPEEGCLPKPVNLSVDAGVDAQVFDATTFDAIPDATPPDSSILDATMDSIPDVMFDATPDATPDAEVCGPDNCEGCCGSGNICHEATTLSRCGIAGSICVFCNPEGANLCVNGNCACGGEASCAAGKMCVNGVCVDS